MIVYKAPVEEARFLLESLGYDKVQALEPYQDYDLETCIAILEQAGRFCTEEMHLTCQTARNGLEALQILSEHPPDLVLSEIDLPDIDGFELVRRVRLVPVVLMANPAAGHTRIEALKRGAKGFSAKPLSLMMLNVELARLLQHRR